MCTWRTANCQHCTPILRILTTLLPFLIKKSYFPEWKNCTESHKLLILNMPRKKVCYILWDYERFSGIVIGCALLVTREKNSGKTNVMIGLLLLVLLIS
jgi:hypothetical protein